MSDGPSSPSPSPPTPRQAQLLALASELRPELHRYCARLMGSVIDGEDVVQDPFTRAYVAVDALKVPVKNKQAAIRRYVLFVGGGV